MPSAGRGDRTDFGTGSPRRRRQEYFCRRFFIERIRRGVSWTVALFPNGCSAFSLFSFACSLFRLSGLSPFRCPVFSSAAFQAHSFPNRFFSLFLFFRLRSVWRFRLPGPLSLCLFPHFARSASGFSSVFVRFRVSRFRFPPPACSVPNNPSSCLAVRFPPRTARNDDADCSGGTGRACGGIGGPCGTGEPAGASSAVGTETSRRGGFRASVRGRIPVVLLASGASVCRLRQERRRQSGMVRFQRLKAVP